MQYLWENNISWYCVPAAFLLALFPRLWGTTFGPGNRQAKGALARSAGPNNIIRERAERSERALRDAFENLPLFAVAVLAGNAEGLGVPALNFLSLLYLAVRAAYTWVCIWGLEDGRLPPTARTIVWFFAHVVLGFLYLLPGEGKADAPEGQYTYWLARAVKLPSDPTQNVIEG